MGIQTVSMWECLLCNECMGNIEVGRGVIIRNCDTSAFLSLGDYEAILMFHKAFFNTPLPFNVDVTLNAFSLSIL